jgi:CrcB protein
VVDGRQIAAVFVGGGLGSAARAAFSAALPWSPSHWPWPTFVVNVAGCAILGYVTTRLQEQLPVSAYRRPLLGTGLCGGLTTFSTMQLELLKMVQAGEIGMALGYAAALVVAGFAAVHTTTFAVRRLWFGWTAAL